MPYIAALDGLRGLAVAAVLAYHAGFSWAQGGFLGVDAFFVLSGYLITALLLAERRGTAAIDLRGFWLRRARRLLPALFLVLCWVAIYAAVFATPGEASRIRGDGMATALYVANWKPILEGDSYFAQFAIPSPLLHTWSLAVEEQWYLVWPLSVVGLLRLRSGSRKIMLVTTVTLAVASAGLMAWLYGPGGDPSRVYYGTDTRAQSLLIGATLAVLMAGVAWRPSGRLARGLLELVAVICLGVVVAAWMSAEYTDAWLYRGGFLVLAVAVAASIGVAVLVPRGLLASALSSPPLRWLGIISYGVYLWHWPIFVLLTPDRVGLDAYALFALRVAVTLSAATASYVLVELPVRRGKLLRSRAGWVLGPVAVASLLALFVVATQGSAVATNASVSDIPGAKRDAGPARARTATETRVLVVGDSVAFTAAQGLSRVADQSNLAVWNQAKLGCGVLRADRIYVDGEWKPQDPACNDWPSRWAGYIDVFQPDVVVVLAGTWDVQDREVGGRRMEFGSSQFGEFVRSEMEAAIHVLSSGGGRVVLLTTPHYQPPELALGGASARFDVARIDRLNGLYADVVKAHPQTATVIDLAAFVDGAGGAAALTGDGVHFTVKGGDQVARWLAPQLTRLAPPRSARLTATEAPSTSIATPPRWIPLLGLIADTPEHRAGIVMNDYVRFREAYHVPLPSSDSSEEAIAGYYRALLFDAQGSRTGLVMAQAPGVSGAPVLDQDARRRRVGLAADAWSLDGSTQELVPVTGAPWCAAGCSGAADEASLATDEPFALLAAALADSNTYTAFFSSDTSPYVVSRLVAAIAGPDADAAKLESTRASLAAEPALRPFEAYATGAGVDGQGQFTALVLLQGDEVAARANAELLRDRIASGTSWLAGRRYAELIDGADISAEGRLVVARLRTSSALFWFALPAAADTLLLHD